MSGTSCGVASVSGMEGRFLAGWKIRGVKIDTLECLWQHNNRF